MAATTAVPATAPQRLKKAAFDLEEKLGTNWLNKLGVIILVLGVALWVAYKLPTLSAGGKVLVGYVVSFALLGGSVWLERKARYRLLARTGIGGGWALVYFITYAMHHVPGARVLDSQRADLVLLLVVGAGMVAHTLRYDSQLVTGFAFLLAFATVTISHEKVYSLSAGAVLAVGLVAVVLRRRWYELEIFGLLASYLNHFFWLRPIVAAMGPQRHPFPEFVPSALLLVFYWAIFRASYLLRRPADQQQEKVSALAALLNGGLLLGLMRYQSVRPELAFWFLLGLGAVELALGQLPLARRRRMAFIVLTTVGTSLLIAAVPFRYSGSNLTVLWLVEAEALFVVGVLAREVVFRHFGVLAAVLAAAHLLAVDAWALYQTRMLPGKEAPEWRLALICGVATLLFYANAHGVARRWRELFKTDFERSYLAGLSYLAALLAFVGAWLAWPGVWTAVAWGALALILTFAGSHLAVAELSLQAHGFAAAAFAWALGKNLYSTAELHGTSLRLMTLALAAGLLYACARWSRLPWLADARSISAAYTWAGSLLVALLAWKELPWAWTGPAWAAFTLVLLLAGRRLGRHELVWQADVLALVGLVRAVLVNIEGTGNWHGISLRLVTVSLIAVLLYLNSWWRAGRDFPYAEQAPSAYTWAGSLLVALLAWKELPTLWTPVAWAAFGLVLHMLGRGLARRELPVQAHALAAAAFLWALGRNFGVTGVYVRALGLRLVTVTLIGGLLYVSSRWATQVNTRFGRSLSAAYTWAGSTLVMLLMWYELQPASVALGWALFGLVTFELGWGRRSASLRLQAYTALSASFVRLFIANLNAVPISGELDPRLYTTMPLTFAYYYVYIRLKDCPADGFEMERKLRSATYHSYLGVATLAALVRFEFHPDWVVAGWAALVGLLLAAALPTNQGIFLHQGLLLGLAVLFRTAFHNFALPRYYPPGHWQRPVLTVGSAVALLFISLPFAFRLRAKSEGAKGASRLARFWTGLVRRPEQELFFIPLGLVTVLVALEVRKGMMTVAWGLEGVLVFLVALWARERSYRLAGLALLLLCVGKIVVVDVWGLGPADRYVTFICLGVALLLVSFLYTRYRETLRQYL